MATTEQALIKVVEGQIELGSEYRLAVSSLAQEAALVRQVTNAEECALAKSIIDKATKYTNEITAMTAGEDLRLKTRWADFRAEVDKMRGEFTSAVDRVATLHRQYVIEEAAAARREQARINANLRPSEHVEVKPAVPTGSAAIKGRYRVSVVDQKPMFRLFWKSPKKYLKYFMLNVDLIQKEFREAKGDPAQFAKQFPGLKFWIE